MEDGLIKMLAHKDYVAEVLEEVFLVNKEQKKLLGFISIVEQAKYDLKKIVSVWKDKKKSKELLERFTDEKLVYFQLKAMETIDYMHKRNAYFGDMKSENLLVFRDLKVKLGDLGVSIKIKDGQEEIYLRGLTQEYSLKEINTIFNNNDPLTKKQLYENDQYSLFKTFEKIYNELKDKI